MSPPAPRSRLQIFVRAEGAGGRGCVAMKSVGKEEAKEKKERLTIALQNRVHN